MNVLERLASASGKREKDLNIELAQEIARSKDKKAIKDLIQAWQTNPKP